MPLGLAAQRIAIRKSNAIGLGALATALCALAVDAGDRREELQSDTTALLTLLTELEGFLNVS